ncbi:mCG1044715, partial [Mus musculus]
SFMASQCYSYWRTLMKTELHICYIHVRGLSPACVSYLDAVTYEAVHVNFTGEE